MENRIYITDQSGYVKAGLSGADEVILAWKGEYAEGDVNYDWKVNSTDIVAASKSLLGIEGYAGYEVESILELIRLKKLLAN